MSEIGVGFFGKVTSHGDFVSRRLPVSFSGPWDQWLQAGLQSSRAKLGPQWLVTYLGGPIWRFALAPGVCGPQAWTGVLMPSVDRVGRHFPLTVAVGIDGAAPLLEWAGTASSWYDRIEDLALGSLRENFSLDEFDAALQQISAPVVVPEKGVSSNEGGGMVVFDMPGDGHTMAPAQQLNSAITATALQQHSLWWSEGSQDVRAAMLVCRGLPASSGFAALLDGQWASHGWHRDHLI